MHPLDANGLLTGWSLCKWNAVLCFTHIVCCVVDADYMGRLASAVTTIRGVNRSDAYSLARHFGSLADAFR